MDPCANYESSIESMLADEIDEAARLRLLRHAETCADCREYVDLHHALLEPAEAELPTERQFGLMRAKVLRRLRQDRGAPVAGWGPRLRAWLLPPGTRPAHVAVMAGLGLAVLVAGVLAGRQMTPRPVVLAGVLPELSEEARSNVLLSDADNSPYVYSNVAFRRTGQGRVQLSFDVTRHLALTRPVDDPLVKEVLVQSLLNPSNVGTRLQAVSFAGSMMDPKVKQALIRTLLNDSNQAVRMKSLEILAGYHDDPEVQSALLAVLRGEGAVRLRLSALDVLATSDLGQDRLGRAMQELDRGDDQALLVRAATYSTPQTLIREGL